jgi:type II secretory pathway component PulK
MLGDIEWNAQNLKAVMESLIPIVAIIGGIWWMIERTRSEAELKRSMIERGMSADEIERVLKTKARN